MNFNEYVKGIHSAHVKDWNRKKMKHKLEENPDWAIKRVSAILREAERLGVEIKKEEICGGIGYSDKLQATWKGLPLEGRFMYEARGGHYCESHWMRPRIVLRFWIKTRTLDRYGIMNDSLLDYTGKELYRSMMRHHKGGETLEIVFGKERMMVYNRLMPATLNCMGKIR